jgi:CheY-like chemotaxis protein
VRTRAAVEAPANATEPMRRSAWVEVADTGVGMDDEARRRCLEPFFTTKGERGTGLGLAMVYGVIQRHSADIVIESAVGQGTTMRLKFAVPAVAATPAVRTVSAPDRSRCLRILLVDDDPLLLKSLRDTLEAEGHTLVPAHGGQEGIESFQAAHESGEPFDVVITDLGMPYVDGRKVASSIKEISRATPVILLTGWGQRLVAEGDVPPHVDRVMNKPPKPQQLREELALCCPAADRSA